MKLGKWALCLCLLGSLFLQSHALAQASPASKGKASVFSFENTRLGGFYQDDAKKRRLAKVGAGKKFCSSLPNKSMSKSIV